MRIAMPESISGQDLESLAREAFIYGFSLVESMSKTYTMGTFPNVPMGAPVNTFGHARQLVDAKTGRRLGIVSPNNDTLYSISQVDVGKEPLVFHVPATGDRYYVMQFVDAWSNNFVTWAHEQPAPAGAFRPILRMYMPRQEAFDESQWYLPPIRRVE